MPLHPGQVKYLRAVQSNNYRIFVLTPANRYGKSTMIACLQLWYLYHKFGIPPGNRAAWFKAEYRTANIAPDYSMSEPVFKAIHQIMTSSFAIRTPDGRVVTNKCQIEWFYLPKRTHNTPPYKQFFHNNSYIEHRSLGGDQGNSLQGKPYGIITYDEGGRSHHLKDEVMGNIIPRLADWIGPFHLLSTPDFKSPSLLYHHQLYKDGLGGLNQTYTQEGSLKENLLLGEKQIAAQYALYEDNPLGPQVLDGKFIVAGNTFFSIDKIEAAQDEKLDDGERAQTGHKYVIGSDTAMGSDEMVHSALDITTLRVTTDEHGREVFSGEARLVKQTAAKGNSKSPQRHLNDFCDLFDAYSVDGNRPPHLLETWNGESARFYQDLPMYIQSLTSCYGSWQPEKRTTENKNPTRNKSKDIKKADILTALNKLLSAGVLKIPKNDSNWHPDGADLSQQLVIYQEKDDNLPTDRVISLALAAFKAIEVSKQTELRWISV